VLSALVVVAAPTAPAAADQTRDSQWHLGFLSVSRAQQISQGDGVVVGVVDTGVDARHPDLVGNVLAGAEMAVASGDGRTDSNGHGTNMAGLIAAHGHDGGGALGIAPKAKVLPVSAGAYGALTNQPRAIDWAVGHGATVLCLAFGGPSNPDLQRAVENANAHDIVVVAAPGNTTTTFVDFPAAYPGVVAVGGVDMRGEHAALSTSGPQILLAAPSVDVVSTIPGASYGSGTGTSAATAIVAGVAALVRSKFPKMPATEVIHRLTATAIDKGPKGRDDQYGYGIVNPVGALTADIAPLSSPSARAGPAKDRGRPFALIAVTVAVLAAAGLVIAVVRLRTRTRTS
jgi:type VII secretion-associated serine protease mycosin